MKYQTASLAETYPREAVIADLDSMAFRALNAPQVLALWERLVANARLCGDPLLETEALLWRHRYIAVHGAAGQALAARDSARAICSRLDDKPGLALCDVWDAYSAVTDGRYAEAIMTLRHALPQLATHRSPVRSRLDGLYTMAWVCYVIAMYDEALQAAIAMVPLAESLGDMTLARSAKVIELRCMAGVARMAHQALAHAPAEDHQLNEVVKALEVQIELDRQSPEGAHFDASFLLFELLTSMGRVDEAVAMWREHIDLRPAEAVPGADGLLALYLYGPERAIEMLLPWTHNALNLPADMRHDVWGTLCLAYERHGDFHSALHAAKETFRYAQERASQNAMSLAKLLGLELEMAREHALAQRALVHAGKLAAVGQLASSVAHEISQPAGALMLLCLEGRESLEAQRWPEVSDCLVEMEKQVERLRRLIMRMKDFSRDDPVDIRCLSLAQVVEEAHRLVRPAVRAAGVLLQVDVPDLMVLADQESVVLSLVNLVNNALDALRGQESPLPRLRIVGEQDGKSHDVKLMVIDNGPGLSDLVMASVFQPFFTTKACGHGLGLGLTITRHALVRTGAHLDVQNEPERGACFTVHLPAADWRPGSAGPDM